MELAIPLVALGGMYVISNQSQNKDKEGLTKKSNLSKEHFNNMGITSNLQEKTPESKFSNYLPNTNIPPQNFPVINNNQLIYLICYHVLIYHKLEFSKNIKIYLH